MKSERCPKCAKIRFNNSPVSYVWWRVMGHGRMCWHCYAAVERAQRVGGEA